MKLILSGIQATSELTIGNYFGSIKQFIDIQNDKDLQLILFVADLHSITVDFDPVQLQQNKQKNIMLYNACGLDFDKIKIFYQSSIKEHTYLGYILTTHTTIGQLSRMTQFKDKTAKIKQANGTEKLPTGLLIYPVLMAADILLYDPDYVIVGADQKQHLELTRDIAMLMNHKYGNDLFKVPNLYIARFGSKIRDLQDPNKKMSKSNQNKKGTIFLLDDLKLIKKKIMEAKTDSFNQIKYDWDHQPGIANLIEIYHLVTNIAIDEIEIKFQNENYATFKKSLCQVLLPLIQDIQDKYYQNINNDFLKQKIASGLKFCQAIAAKKIKLLESKIGLAND